MQGVHVLHLLTLWQRSVIVIVKAPTNTEKPQGRMPDRLYHVSDTPGISLFRPRPAQEGSGIVGNVVWGIDRAHLHNYLFPRDCPRVTFYPQAESTGEDIERLMGPGGARHVVAIEAGWLPKLLEETIHLYEFESSTFSPHDPTAGYWISREPVAPIAERPVNDIAAALLRHDVELRIMPTLWGLHDAVAASSLAFSIIRMRNALPRM